MMMPSHLAATVLAGLLLSRVRPWGPRHWALALGFGVLIDLDHALQVVRYAREHGGVQAFADPAAVLSWGDAWQGFAHEPWAAALVLAACLVWRSPVPAGAWGLHMVLDFVVARHYVPFGGPLEWALLAGMAAGIGGLLVLDHRAGGAREAFPRYVRHRALLAAASLLAAVRR